jgi:omega-amidase
MQNELNIALIQTDLVWKDRKTNLSNIEKIFLSIKEEIDIIILPEMFSTAFCVDDVRLAEDINGETISWMQRMAKEKNAAICGSILYKEDSHYYNRFLFVDPNGKIHFYNKHHLFSLVNEHQYLTKGNDKLVISFRGWKIQHSFVMIFGFRPGARMMKMLMCKFMWPTGLQNAFITGSCSCRHALLKTNAMWLVSTELELIFTAMHTMAKVRL